MTQLFFRLSGQPGLDKRVAGWVIKQDFLIDQKVLLGGCKRAELHWSHGYVDTIWQWMAVVVRRPIAELGCSENDAGKVSVPCRS
jgi:hypothetical protein